MIKTFLLAGLGWLFFAFVAIAGHSQVYTTGNGAVSGYDPVAYFTENRAVEGKSEITYDWNGSTYRFSNQANRDLFAKNPKKYAPQYGGFCAFAVAQGSTAPTDPTAWSIVDGKLYLNYNSSVRQMWSADIPGHIRSADNNWPKLGK